MKNSPGRFLGFLSRPPCTALGLLLRTGPVLFMFLSPDLLAAAVPGGGSATGEDDNSTLIMAVLFGVVLLLLAVIVVGGLTLWSKKQDEINHMMFFCIKYLIDSQNQAERYKAAKELGRAKEPGALLILLDVIIDERGDEMVHDCASTALMEMSQKYRKYRTVIKDLISAVEESDHQKIIDLLISNFEGKGKKYVQTAYVIGREHMRLGNLEEAREWLLVAAFRNRKTPTYGNQIKELAEVCNRHLFAEGDRLFKAGCYHDAKAHYAIASQGLEDEEKKRFASYLRQASAYCKLEDYQEADQALLQALQHHHETDLTLTLNKLLRKRLDQSESAGLTYEERKELDTEIDECVSDIMEKLTTSTP